ncbi:uncharacterized protein LOC126315442 [Schistocerca gregaria]|uniref:uncharacterized protein LOC126315442 n=1 Tax=Schistocerca gregaria TaxID=7010 RepID=UPI00211DB9F4|nr:uncharacterized protein LOC126315442 [Schistocerca gregaria]
MHKNLSGLSGIDDSYQRLEKNFEFIQQGIRLVEEEKKRIKRENACLKALNERKTLELEQLHKQVEMQQFIRDYVITSQHMVDIQEELSQLREENYSWHLERKALLEQIDELKHKISQRETFYEAQSAYWKKLLNEYEDQIDEYRNSEVTTRDGACRFASSKEIMCLKEKVDTVHEERLFEVE